LADYSFPVEGWRVIEAHDAVSGVPMNREYLVERRGDALHVLLTGEVDLLAAPALRRAIDRAVAVDGSRIVINLDAVTFVDSAGLGVLVAGYQTAAILGIGYEIGPAAVPAVARVLAITGLDALAVDQVADEETGSAS